MKSFKINKKIKEAWPLFKKNFSMFLLFLVIVLVLSYISNLITLRVLSLGGLLYYYLLTIIITLFEIGISFIFLRFILDIVEGKDFILFSKKSMPGFKTFINFVLVFILTGIPMFAISFILVYLINLKITNDLFLILIGFFAMIYLSIRLMFATYLVVDKKENAISSINRSWKITENKTWSIFRKTFVIGLFVFVGFLALLVGGFITYPMGMIIIAMLYKHLDSDKHIEVVERVETVVGSKEAIKDSELLRE